MPVERLLVKMMDQGSNLVIFKIPNKLEKIPGSDRQWMLYWSQQVRSQCCRLSAWLMPD
jgi:hypothetical protein